jgi:hypothetical protein
MPSDQLVVLHGDARIPGGTPAPSVVTLGPAELTVVVGDSPPWQAAYRDLATVAVDDGAVLVALGRGPGSERWLFERFGSGLAALVRGLRDGRLRQWLSDGLARFDPATPIELVEFSTGVASGVGQLLYLERGVALAPLDERQPPVRVRRADIGSLTVTAEAGGLQVAGVDGPLAAGLETLGLVHLGSLASAERDRWAALRDGGAGDMATIIAGLIPDADFGVRRTATATMREGRPVDQAMLGDAWPVVEAAVLAEPSFAESFQALVALAGGPASARWLAIAPTDPGVTDQPKIWFLVGLPGNLVALELVSGGAHATYCFRVAPRASFAGGVGDPAQVLAAVGDVSEALVDARFLREPMAIPEAQLATQPEYLRYRLALRALPSLARARQRFVARLVHGDPVRWSAALEDLIRWHGSERDEAAEWPGRAAQEAAVSAAAGGEAGDGDTDPATSDEGAGRSGDVKT